MMAPNHMRAMLLHEVIRRAVDEFEAHIDRIEISGGKAIVTANGRRIVYDCQLRDSFDERGNPLLGSASWAIQTVDGGRPGWLRRLFGR